MNFCAVGHGRSPWFSASTITKKTTKCRELNSMVEIGQREGLTKGAQYSGALDEALCAASAAVGYDGLQEQIAIVLQHQPRSGRRCSLWRAGLDELTGGIPAGCMLWQQ